MAVATMCISDEDSSTAEAEPQLQPALGIVDHLRRRFARFYLCAHFL